jgi:hypothetical protein
VLPETVEVAADITVHLGRRRQHDGQGGDDTLRRREVR